MGKADGHQVVTLTFFKYDRPSTKVWAFGMMQFAHRHLAKLENQTFYRLMGVGKGRGFNPWPNWSSYALMQVWQNEKAAREFFSEHELVSRYRKKAKEVWTIYMKPILAKGEWVGQNPFEKNERDPNNPLVAVITRATIKKSKLIKFWKYVPTSEKPLDHNDGLIFTKGVGEVPIVQMATFSIWKDEASLKQFAYESHEHAVAIKKTRELDWYSEELFSRFQPFYSEGTWGGKEVLKV